MLGRTYEVSQTVATVAAAQTLGILTMPADRIALLEKVEVTSRGQPVAEQLDIELARVSALGTPTVSHDNDAGGNNDVIVQQHDEGDAATGATVSFDVTASEPTLIASPINRQGVQNMDGYRFNADVFQPVVVGVSQSVAVKLMAAPNASHELTVTFKWREIGT